MVRKQILKARAFSRDTLLEKVKEVRNNDRFVLTLTYHPSIKNFQNVLNEAHILLTPKKEHRKVFGDKPPMIGWRKPKSLKDHLVSAKIKCEPSSGNKIAPCCRSRYQICPFIEETKTFQNKDKSETFDIRNGILNCSTDLVVYLIECKSCSTRMWVVLLHCSVAVLIIAKVGPEKCQKFIPRNVMSIKNNFTVTLTLRDTVGCRTGRLLSSIGLKMF